MSHTVTMAVKKRITNVASGFNYSVYLGCDTRDGHVLLGTADRVIHGWAPTRSAADSKAMAAIKQAA